MGGFRKIRDSLRSIASDLGVTVRTGARVAAIDTTADGRRVTGVTLDDGEEVKADLVVSNRQGSVLGTDSRCELILVVDWEPFPSDGNSVSRLSFIFNLPSVAAQGPAALLQPSSRRRKTVRS